MPAPSRPSFSSNSKFKKSPGARPRSGGRRFGKPFVSRRKVCRFCADHVDYVDFKNVNMLRAFITDRGKVLSSRITGVCMYHQRGLAQAIKRARNIALLPFAPV